MEPIVDVVDDYQNIFVACAVDVAEEEWMPIKQGAVPKVYPLSQKDHDVVDTTNGELHLKARCTTQRDPPAIAILSDYARRRAVIGICGLNLVTEVDSHPLPLLYGLIL